MHVLLPLKQFAFSAKMIPMALLFALIVTIGCILIDLLRQMLFGKAEKKLSEILAGILHKALSFLRKTGCTAGQKINTFIQK